MKLHEDVLVPFSGFPHEDTRGTRLAITPVLDGLCALVSQITNAPTVLIAQRDQHRNSIWVKGRYGTLINQVDMTFVIPELDLNTRPVLAVQDLRHDPRFAQHPLLALMPHAKSIIAMLVPTCPKASRAVLKIFNPRKSVFANAEIWNALTEVCKIVAAILALDNESSHALIPLDNGEVRAAHGPTPCSAGPAAQFLIDTLTRKRTLHARNGADYVTLRSWKSQLKHYQISALAAFKEMRPPEFVKIVAMEIADSVLQSHGSQVIANVVPVPGGNSGRADAFSTLIASEVATLLKADFADVLVGQGGSGGSTPRKSSLLRPYRVTGEVSGPVLIVDDVASSGRHLELAIKALKSSSRAVYGIAWIGK